MLVDWRIAIPEEGRLQRISERLENPDDLLDGLKKILERHKKDSLSRLVVKSEEFADYERGFLACVERIFELLKPFETGVNRGNS
jgi:HEPN domain-containing protein